MSEHDEVTLASVTEKPQYGAIASGSSLPSGPRFVRQTDLVGGSIDWSTVPYCDLAASDVGKYSLSEDDLLIARLGSVGRAARVRETRGDAVFAGYLVRFRALPHVADPAFLGYQLQSPAWWAHVDSVRSGAVQPTLNAKQMGAFRFRLPSLPEQQRIAGVLLRLDDLIEANLSLTQELEELVATAFASERFDGEPAQASVSLGELVSVNPKMPKPSGPAPYIDMAALPTQGPRIVGVSQRPPAGGARFQTGDALLARLTPCLENGKAAFVDVLKEGEIATGSTEFIVLRGGPEVGQHWPYLLVRSPRFREYAIRHMTGTSGRQRCSADAVQRYLVPRPSEDALKRFKALATPAFAAVTRLHEEVEDLRRTRDELLPLLMSGAIQVGEPE